MIYVVLGMGKSGTSLLAGILHASGIHMGEDADVLPYDRGGFRERQEFRELNRSILGTRSARVIPKTGVLRDGQWRPRMRSVIEDCERRFQDWGFKDPRTALLYPLWATELPRHRIIAIYRPYQELWLRFRQRGWRKYGNVWKARHLARLWCYYNERILSHLQETRMEHLLLSYPELMTTDAEFKRMEQFVGRPLRDLRDQGLYRNRGSESWVLGMGVGWARLQLRVGPDEVGRRLEEFHRAQRLQGA
jgi:hypothetical protein